MYTGRIQQMHVDRSIRCAIEFQSGPVVLVVKTKLYPVHSVAKVSMPKFCTPILNI